jgi:hypothetical protein
MGAEFDHLRSEKMRKLLWALVVLSLSFFFTSVAHAQDTVEVFGGYSYLRPPVSVIETILPPACPIGILPPCGPITRTIATHPNLNGWELSGAFYPNKWLGAAADFSGHYGTAQGSSVHLQTYLFGPQIRLPGPVSPFAHVLIGGAHETLGGNANPGISSASASAFAAAVGAGIDIKVAPFASLRAIQLDYLVTRFGSTTQNQPRASAGVVFHF